MTRSQDRGPAAPLVAHHGAIGDTIQLTAMLATLAARWGAPCAVVSGCRAAPAVLAGLDEVGPVRVLPTRKTPYRLSPAQRGLVAWLERRPPAPCYVVERWRRPIAPWSRRTRLEWLLARGGHPAERWVTTEALARGDLEHAVDYQRRLAAFDPSSHAGRGGPPPEPPPEPRLTVSAAERADCRAWLEEKGWLGAPLVCVQATARRRNRGRWPAAAWTELFASVLADLPAARVVILGAPAERREARALEAAAGDPRVREAAAELPLRRLFALLAEADSLISLDSAPVHAAAAVGCPAVVLAGTADPRRNRPRGAAGRVRVVTAFDGGDWPADGGEWFARHRMEAIPVAAVAAAWRALGRRTSTAG